MKIIASRNRYKTDPNRRGWGYSKWDVRPTGNVGRLFFLGPVFVIVISSR